MVFSYLVRGENQFFFTISPPLFSALLESSWLKLYFFRLICFKRSAKNVQQCLLRTEKLELLVEIVEIQ